MSRVQRVSVEREGRVGATFHIEGLPWGLSYASARLLTLELAKRVVAHERALAANQAVEADRLAIEYRRVNPIARS